MIQDWRNDLVQRPEQQTTRGRAMMPTAALVTTAFAALTVAALTSCDRTPTTPTAPTEPVTTRIELIAPRTLAPGATTRVSVIAHRSDGTTQDITATANLSSQVSDVLAVSPDGIVTALKVGESWVHAHSAPFAIVHEVVVVPDGTFRVKGQVIEADTPTLGIATARVEADGVAPILSDSQGFYSLYGVPGQALMRVSKSGYVTRELSIAISDHQTQNITLSLGAPRLDVTGTYQLVIEAALECRGRIPEPLLTRRYSAEITQNGAVLRGRASGATFAVDSNVFGGLVEPTRALLEFLYDPYYYGDAALVEIIDDTTYFVISGRAPLSPVGRGFTGTLDGSLLIFSRVPRRDVGAVASCNSQSHRLALTR